MSQDEIIEAMQRLGGKDLYAKQIRTEFMRIHFGTDFAEKNYKNASFTYGLRRCYLAGTVTRRLENTNSVAYRTLKKFVYSLA